MLISNGLARRGVRRSTRYQLTATGVLRALPELALALVAVFLGAAFFVGATFLVVATFLVGATFLATVLLGAAFLGATLSAVLYCN